MRSLPATADHCLEKLARVVTAEEAGRSELLRNVLRGDWKPDADELPAGGENPFSKGHCANVCVPAAFFTITTPYFPAKLRFVPTQEPRSDLKFAGNGQKRMSAFQR